MIAADAIRVGVFVALPFAPSAGAVVGLAFVAGLATGFFRPAVYAGVPNLVEAELLPKANALLQTVENMSWMLGPVLGAVAGPTHRLRDQRRVVRRLDRADRRGSRPGFCRASGLSPAATGAISPTASS